MRYFLNAICCLLLFGPATAQTTYLFVGTYTDSKPDTGIYVYRLNTKTGELVSVARGKDLINPSFLTISSNGQYLYACTDTKKATEGSITSFKIDTRTGNLKLISKEGSGGANPAYVSVDKNNRFVVNAGYTSGEVSLLPTDANGILQPVIQKIPFIDSSVNKTRQHESHIHSVVFSPDFDYLFSPDLGADKIRVFTFNAAAAKPLTEMPGLTVKTQPGSGPRHIIFHPNKKFAYCTEEMSGMVSAYSYNAGKLSAIQHIMSNKVPAKEYSSADIHLSPDGKFLYASNRGENTVSIFSINANGQLKLAGHISTFGDTPRNFAIDPSGNYLIVANQMSNNLVVFRRDKSTGLLQRTGHEVSVFNPSSIQIRAYTP